MFSLKCKNGFSVFSSWLVGLSKAKAGSLFSMNGLGATGYATRCADVARKTASNARRINAAQPGNGERPSLVEGQVAKAASRPWQQVRLSVYKSSLRTCTSQETDELNIPRSQASSTTSDQPADSLAIVLRNGRSKSKRLRKAGNANR